MQPDAIDASHNAGECQGARRLASTSLIMSSVVAEAPSRPSAVGEAQAVAPRHLYGPFADFLLLGAASFAALLAVGLFLSGERDRAVVALVMMVVANFVNHPHFAHSYQLFYTGFRDKAFGSHYAPDLRSRYQLAGIVAPALIVAFFATCWVLRDPLLLGFGGVAMSFLVGWHYVKQGYGMAILDSVYKRRFYSAPEKKLLLVNAYVVWIVAWVAANRGRHGHEMWGIRYYTLGLPEWLWQASVALAVVTGLAVLAMLVRRWRAGGASAITPAGVVGYLVSLYAWLLFVHLHPLFIYVTPAFHSLQYLAVVWKYRGNYEAGRPDAREAPAAAWLRAWLPTRARARFAGFLLNGVVLGAIGFWGLPLLMEALVLPSAPFGQGAFLFMAWILINVHHYFIDNVIWRAGNPDTRRYLFEAQPAR